MVYMHAGLHHAGLQCQFVLSYSCLLYVIVMVAVCADSGVRWFAKSYNLFLVIHCMFTTCMYKILHTLCIRASTCYALLLVMMQWMQ